MKRMAIFAAVAAVMSAGAFAADYQVSEVVQTTSVAVPDGIYTVRQVQDMADDTSVILTGRVTGQVTDEKYIFEDANGDRIMVDIDDATWRNQNVTSGDTVQIYGEIDRNSDGTVEIEVETIQKM